MVPLLLVAILTILAGHPAPLASAAALVNSPTRHRALQGPDCCFAADCPSYTLDPPGHVLHATCRDKVDQRGHWPEVASSLDLAHCVANFNGVLAPASE